MDQPRTVDAAKQSHGRGFFIYSSGLIGLGVLFITMTLRCEDFEPTKSRVFKEAVDWEVFFPTFFAQPITVESYYRAPWRLPLVAVDRL